MTTITRERLLKIQQWRETYGTGSNVMLPAEEAEELARIALASLEAEPIGAFHIEDQQVSGTTDYIKDGEWPIDNGVIEVYAAPPAPVDNEFIPKNLDKALGVVGVALPESKEEFNFQTERWIQRLIDRVIRYANEFKEQPVPVVPDEWTIQDAVKFCRETGRQDAGSAMDAWNACRSAMLNGGKS
ncbi:hypothetical protein LXS72_003419 [Salmonella enterica]|nr:hypothetical protein [Salmonella enterica subsp. enterica serovar Newport]EIR9427434.1 hypothetical protein [Salmonella enterica]ELH1018583.1 hypothetical protein [Salmonella enterica]ELJ7053556.1 hypothetical protein [Salmonella enterica]ELP6912552.1 hypothetical protein [Salmonella enterica]